MHIAYSRLQGVCTPQVPSGQATHSALVCMIALKCRLPDPPKHPPMHPPGRVHHEDCRDKDIEQLWPQGTVRRAGKGVGWLRMVRNIWTRAYRVVEWRGRTIRLDKQVLGLAGHNVHHKRLRGCLQGDAGSLGKFHWLPSLMSTAAIVAGAGTAAGAGAGFEAGGVLDATGLEAVHGRTVRGRHATIMAASAVSARSRAEHGFMLHGPRGGQVVWVVWAAAWLRQAAYILAHRSAETWHPTSQHHLPLPPTPQQPPVHARATW